MATNSKFQTMGTSFGTGVSNQSGAPSKNTKPVARKGSAGGDIPGAGGKGDRKQVLGRNGFKGAPQVNVSYPNAPEAANTMRQVRLMPSATGASRDFYFARNNIPYGVAPSVPGFPSGSWTPPTKP